MRQLIEYALDKEEMSLKYVFYPESQIHEFRVNWPAKKWWGHQFHSRDINELGQKLAMAIKEATNG